MKKFNKQAAQGDTLITAIDEIPDSAKSVRDSNEDGELIVAHSETGHHHVIDKQANVSFFAGQDPFTFYLDVKSDWADLLHRRDWDTHEVLRIPKGKYLFKRQREMTLEGWKMVQD